MESRPNRSGSISFAGGLLRPEVEDRRLALDDGGKLTGEVPWHRKTASNAWNYHPVLSLVQGIDQLISVLLRGSPRMGSGWPETAEAYNLPRSADFIQSFKALVALALMEGQR
jgi:hypothetical protein